MLKVIIGALLSFQLGFATSASSETLDINPLRLVKIVDVIDISILPKAKELLALASMSKEPIYMLINSPGGSIRAGDVFISAMEIAKSRGIAIKCVSSIYAASMAFSILAACSERYALAATTLLFHPARVYLPGPMTAGALLPLAVELDSLDRKLITSLSQSMGLALDIFIPAFYEEKWWSAVELQSVTKEGWITIVDDVTGSNDLFTLPTENNKPRRSLFEYTIEELIYEQTQKN